MLPSPSQLRTVLHHVIGDKADQGFDISGLAEEIDGAGDSLDALAALADHIADLPFRADWPWVEPVGWDEVRAEFRSGLPAAVSPPHDEAARIENAFLARCAGCVLGKPFELVLTLDTIERALRATGEWPLNDYPTLAALDHLPWRHLQWAETTREHMHWVAADDDLNYTIIGMLLLERRGLDFTVDELARLWMLQLPIRLTFGPERTMLVRAGLESLEGGDLEGAPNWAATFNPSDEWCGALIRMDAYGYVSLGNPAQAAELAWRDATFTHRRTGVYASMFVAAALALAPSADDPLQLFEDAVAFVPQRSRFADAAYEALELVRGADDWLDGYRRINGRWPEFTHCRIYQEIGTLMNALRFASDCGDAFTIQVMQGNDTDSYGATAGSLAGLFFGPGSLEERWITPFEDRFHPGIALFHDQSLSSVAARMGRLPAVVRGEAERPNKDLPY